MLFPTYNRVAILSSGRYGCELAIQFANIGMPVLLFDLASDDLENPCAKINANIDQLYTTSAGIFSRRSYRHYITARTYQHDIKSLSSCDLVLCAINDVVSDKQGLWLRLAPFLQPNAALVTLTNTHGLSILANGLPETLRKQLCGCHWMLPLHVHEYVGISHLSQTLPQTVERVSLFFERVLGKTVLNIYDSPLNIAQDFSCFWLATAQLTIQNYGLAMKTLDDWIVDEYNPALTTEQLISYFRVDRLQRYAEQLDDEDLGSFLANSSTAYAELISQDVTSKDDTESFRLFFGSKISDYLINRAQTLGILLSDYVAFIADFFLFKPEVLLPIEYSEDGAAETSIPKLKSIHAKWPEWLVVETHSYGTEITVNDIDDTEMNLKQLEAFEDLCLNRLTKLDHNNQSLVIQFNDYSPTALPDSLYHRDNSDKLNPKRCEEWAVALVRVCRILFDRSVPTITVLSGHCSGFAALSAMYSSNTVVHDNLTILPVCHRNNTEMQSLPVPGYHYALKERLIWQREVNLSDTDSVLQLPKNSDITWGAMDAKQKGWVGRNALIVSNMSELSEVIPHYMKMNSHTFTWTASLPKTVSINETHPWSRELQYYQ
jgi:3-hydroxyacyl-CoA dehydrogenase